MRSFISMISLLATIGMIVAVIILCFFIHNLSSQLEIETVDPGNGLTIPPPTESSN